MIRTIIPGTTQRITIDSVTETLSTTMPSGLVVTASPFLGTDNFIVVKNGNHWVCASKGETVRVFVREATAVTDIESIADWIMERWAR